MKKIMNDRLIHKNETYVVAVSGGIDSMVLLDLVASLRETKHISLYVAHVNHNVREASSADEAFVEGVCKKLNIPFKSITLQKNMSENFHSKARDKRYAFFYDYAKEVHATKVLLAHHANDQIETILMRLVRGSSFIGYKGMSEITPYKDISLIRPLLKTPKSAIQNYQKKHNIAFVEDESNAEDHYTRNRYRHQIVPFIIQENPKAYDKFSQFSTYIEESYELIELHRNDFISKYVSLQEDKISFPKDSFCLLPSIVKKDVLTNLVNQISQNSIEIKHQNLLDILSLIENKKPNLSLYFNEDYGFIKTYDTLSFIKTKNENQIFSYTLFEPETLQISENESVFITENSCNFDGKMMELCYNNLDLYFPITIRKRKPGDKLQFAYGKKKLKDFLIDKKVPMQERDSLLVFESQDNQILWIPGYYKAKTKGSKKLYFIYQKGNEQC